MFKIIFTVALLAGVFGAILFALKHTSTKEKYQAAKFFITTSFCVILAILSLFFLVILF